MWLIKIAQSIPVPVWSAIIASLLTLIGVLFANLNNNQRLRIQLDHESKEKAKERVAELRKSVYLPAAEEIAKAIYMLGQIPTMEAETLNSVGLLQNLNATLSKVQLVSDMQTSSLAGAFLLSYTEVFLNLIIQAKPIHDTTMAIKIRAPHYDETQAEIARIIGRSREVKESGKDHPEILDVLNKSFEFQQNLAKQISDEQAALFNQRDSLNQEFLKNLIPASADLQEKQLCLLIAIRKELAMDSNFEEFSMQMKHATERMSQTLQNIVANYPKV